MKLKFTLRTFFRCCIALKSDFTDFVSLCHVQLLDQLTCPGGRATWPWRAENEKETFGKEPDLSLEVIFIKKFTAFILDRNTSSHSDRLQIVLQYLKMLCLKFAFFCWFPTFKLFTPAVSAQGLGRRGGLSPPLFCKNKNKLNRKLFNKNKGAKNSKKSFIRKWSELLAKTNPKINRHN